MKNDEVAIKKNVRDTYGKVAKNSGSSCCGSNKSSSCGCSSTLTADDVSKNLGYSDEELKNVPEGSNLGLGCGNPTALTMLKEGETVLDLGSGGGFDCFLAANKVGEKGKVIGVDMTAEMLDKARRNAKKGNYNNVEFRLGEIENLPVADNSIDTIISNCVINLSTNKKRVFEEAYRVLKQNGKMAISDIVLTKKLPEAIENRLDLHSSCVSGAMIKDEYLNIIKKAGFKEIEIKSEKTISAELITSDDTKEVVDALRLSEKEAKELAETIRSISLLIYK